MPISITRTDLFPDDTNSLPTAGSVEQAALVDDELEIATEAYFERLQQFSEVTDNIYPALMSTCRNVLAEVAPNRPLRVLDLCSGIGIVSLQLIAADFPVAELTLADLSPVILGRARELLAKRHPGYPAKVTTVALDLLADDLREKCAGPYDLVVTCNAFQHFPRERQAALFAQIRDVLAPNGVFVFESHFKPLRPNWKRDMIQSYQVRAKSQGAPEAFLSEISDHIENFHNYVNLHEVYNWYEAAQFGYFECVFRQDEIGIFAGVR